MKVGIKYITDKGIVILNTSTDDIYDIANIMMDELPIDVDCVKKIEISIEMRDNNARN